MLTQAQARMLRTFRETAGRLGLLKGKTLAAVSGGPDSIALLHLLAEYLPGGSLAVAHVNHRTRGQASDRDESLVRQSAKRLALPCLVTRLPRHPKPPSENTLRDLRYRALEKLARRAGAARIATAHTADDQAETVLLRLARGTGLAGLAGIPESRPLGKLLLVRPLLGIPKAELLVYLRRRKARFATDASNRDLRYARNRVRRRVLPELKRLNPRTAEALLRLSAQAATAADYLKDRARREGRGLIRRSKDSVRVDLAKLKRLHPALRPLVWQEALAGRTLDADHLRALESLAGGTLALPGGITATVAGRTARISAARKTGASRGSRKG